MLLLTNPSTPFTMTINNKLHQPADATDAAGDAVLAVQEPAWRAAASSGRAAGRARALRYEPQCR